MSFVKKSGLIVNTEAPRPLTDKEIENIEKRLVLPKAVNSQVKNLRDQQVLQAFRRLVRKIKLCPQAIGEFTGVIEEQYLKSLAEPGLAVGVIPGEGIGKVTQVALKTRHEGGSAKNVGSGIERLKELIDAIKVRKNPTCTLMLKGFPTREEVIAQGRELVNITIENILENKVPFLIRRDENKDNWWYDTYLKLTGKKLPKSDTFYRLSFSLVKLYNFRLTPSHIAEFIMGLDDRNVCIPSPFSLGFVDIYPTKSAMENVNSLKIEGMENYDLERLYFQTVFLKEYISKNIRGVKGVKDFSISSVELKDFMTIKEGKEESTVNILAFKARNHFIYLSQFEQYFKALGYSVEAKKYDKYSPHHTLIIKKKGKLSDAIKEANPLDIERYGSSWRITTYGGDLRDIFCYPSIDSSLSYCNNIHETVDLFGMETGRTTFIRELYDVMKEGDLNVRHLEIIADVFFSSGKYTGATLVGLEKRVSNPIKSISFQSATKGIKTKALGQQKSYATSITTAIATGQKIPVGSGMVTVQGRTDKDLEKKLADPSLLYLKEKYNPSELTYQGLTLQDEATSIPEDVEIPITYKPNTSSQYVADPNVTYTYDINDFEATFTINLGKQMS